MPRLAFLATGQPFAVEVRNLVIAGWTGRDTAAVERHIAELEAIGIVRPRVTPMFYRLGTNLLTTDKRVDVVGQNSSGEVEFVLLSTPDGMLVGVGSDHTDRKVEAYNVTLAKQVCPKPIASALWRFEDVKEQWNSLTLRSWVTCGGRRRLYQEGEVTQMLPPSDLISRYVGGNGFLPLGTVMFCGTLPVIGDISGGEQFEIELDDPMHKVSLRHAYSVHSMAYDE